MTLILPSNIEQKAKPWACGLHTLITTRAQSCVSQRFSQPTYLMLGAQKLQSRMLLLNHCHLPINQQIKEWIKLSVKQSHAHLLRHVPSTSIKWSTVMATGTRRLAKHITAAKCWKWTAHKPIWAAITWVCQCSSNSLWGYVEITESSIF